MNNDQTFLDEVIRKEAIRNETKGDDPRALSVRVDVPLSVGADAGRSLQCCDHLESPRSLSNVLGLAFSDLSPASNHPGETLTLDEQTFEVKGKYERVFAPNA